MTSFADADTRQNQCQKNRIFNGASVSKFLDLEPTLGLDETSKINLADSEIYF